MAEFNFKLKSDAKEYPSRFGGNEVTLTLPDDLAGIRARVQDGVDADKAIHGLCVGQGLRLTLQKKVKDFLSQDKVTLGGEELVAKDVDVPTMLEAARQAAEAFKIGAPRVAGQGGRQSARVAEAEAKAENATTALRDTYLAVPAAVRKNLRKDFLARGVFTEEQLAEMDAAAA